MKLVEKNFVFSLRPLFEASRLGYSVNKLGTALKHE